MILIKSSVLTDACTWVSRSNRVTFSGRVEYRDESTVHEWHVIDQSLIEQDLMLGGQTDLPQISLSSRRKPDPADANAGKAKFTRIHRAVNAPVPKNGFTLVIFVTQSRISKTTFHVIQPLSGDLTRRRRKRMNLPRNEHLLTK